MFFSSDIISYLINVQKTFNASMSHWTILIFKYHWLNNLLQDFYNDDYKIIYYKTSILM